LPIGALVEGADVTEVRDLDADRALGIAGGLGGF